MKKFLLFGLLLSVFASADTFTTHYNLQKPIDGSEDWGAALRDDLDTIDTQLYVNESGIADHIADTAGAHAATAISSTVGSLVCTTSDTVQEFLDCLDTNFNALTPGGSVNISSAQTITGAKTFSAIITASGGIKDTTMSTGVVHADSDGDLTSYAISNSDIDASAAIARSKIASGTADHVLINDGSGLVSSEEHLAGIRGGTGVSSTATYPTSGVIPTLDATQTFTNKTISGASNTLSNIADTSLNTISTAGKVSNSATTAASANTAGAIVARDGSGNFSAGTITAALSGNASTSTALATNPSDCGSNQFATTIAANGDLTCAVVYQANNAQVANYTLTASDTVVSFTTSTSDLDATLPTAVGISGKQYTLKKSDQSTGKVVLKTTSSQTIDGYASAVIKMATINDTITVVSDGANWKIINFGIFIGARVTTSTTSVNTTATLVVFSATDYDRHGIYSAGTFTAPIDGTYMVTGLLTSSNIAWAANSAFSVLLYKGGVLQYNLGRCQSQVATTLRLATNLSGMIKLVAGDTIDVRALQDVNSALDAGAANIWVAVTRVGN